MFIFFTTLSLQRRKILRQSSKLRNKLATCRWTWYGFSSGCSYPTLMDSSSTCCRLSSHSPSMTAVSDTSLSGWLVEWVSEWVSEWMNEWASEWSQPSYDSSNWHLIDRLSMQVSKWACDGWASERVSGWVVDWWMNEWVSEWISKSGWMSELAGGLVSRWEWVWVNWWMGEWLSECMRMSEWDWIGGWLIECKRMDECDWIGGWVGGWVFRGVSE